LSPQDSAVVSITQINGGEAINVLPDTVVLRGTFRLQRHNQLRRGDDGIGPALRHRRMAAFAAQGDLEFERFPMDAIYALHNWPGIPLGEVALSDGAMMASLRRGSLPLAGKQSGRCR
jgi:metal-dependent amidase/aminoacylase/carboxypeptidase family protein